MATFANNIAVLATDSDPAADSQKLQNQSSCNPNWFKNGE
jgi:hypothetical protein